MIHYSIKDLEHLSGIKAHTLRIWEQRYKLVEPKRTDTNIRYYNDNDLKLILNVSLLKEHGFKISTIAKMQKDEIKEEVLSITQKSDRYTDQIQGLTLAMIDMDEERFEKIIATSTLQAGFEKTVVNIIYPFLVKIGALWQAGSINVAQEHFISNLIRQKTIVAIDGQINSTDKNAKKYLMFLPNNENHELGLLFANYLVRVRSQRVIYLGTSLPYDDLITTSEHYQPDYMVSIFTSYPVRKDVQKYIDKLASDFSDKTILLSGSQVVAQPLDIPENVYVFKKMADLIDFIEENQ
ncbi:MerR family transcriptional regulator [Microscilla marina]|uniref:Transcriptional regulator, MerR family protein n=1 Tax=Microscilla marina ATCC 23134 TaxID=313606 RepID=A1ZGK3_MICM2|nr:MerR family transcriptional regulator [Microscilla marina]EAY30620.1 transcriptional regulator, MerR family protein [Microscilla marina ATCC 23134]